MDPIFPAKISGLIKSNSNNFSRRKSNSSSPLGSLPSSDDDMKSKEFRNDDIPLLTEERKGDMVEYNNL